MNAKECYQYDVMGSYSLLEVYGITVIHELEIWDNSKERDIEHDLVNLTVSIRFRHRAVRCINPGGNDKYCQIIISSLIYSAYQVHRFSHFVLKNYLSYLFFFKYTWYSRNTSGLRLWYLLCAPKVRDNFSLNIYTLKIVYFNKSCE